MADRWLTLLAVAGVTTLLVAPAMAQSSGSGGSSPGSTTTTQPAPSPNQPTPAPPSSAGKAAPSTQSGSAQSDSTQSGTAAPGMSKSGTAKSGTGAGSEQTKNVQKALQDKGMDPGPIDGIMGPKTHAALRAFQKDQKLPETGRADNQTLAKLGVSR